MIPDLRIQGELGSDETLLWQGIPNPARLAQRNTLLSVFGGCFTLFALIWMGGAFFISSIIAGVLGNQFIALTPLFGLIFLIAGLFMLFSPLTAMKRGERTVYALTDRRIIILEVGGKVRSYTSQDLNTLERKDTPDGRGDIIFKRDTHHDADGGYSVQEAGFFGIQDARVVEQLIRQHLKH